MTLRETTDIIKELCANEPNVGFVGVGDVYELNAQQNIQYPAMVITQQTHSLLIDENYYRFHFIIFYVDRLTEDKENENHIQSTAISVLKTLIFNLEGMGVFASFDYTFNTFTERFESMCSGAFVDIQLDVPIDDCDWDNIFDYLKGILNEEVEGKQDKLISGHNIKTINNESLLGSGNIEITESDPIWTSERQNYYKKTDIDKTVSNIEKNIDINAQSILKNGDDITSLQSIVSNIQETLEGDESDFDEYTARTDSKITSIESNKADKRDLNALRDDVDAIDDKVSTLEEKVAEIEQGDISDIKDKIGILEETTNNLETNKADKSEVEEAINNQKFKTINNESILGEGNIVIQVKSGEGIYISEDEEGAKVISTSWIPNTKNDKYVAYRNADGSVSVDYFNDGIIPREEYAYRNDIVDVVIGDGITMINGGVFNNCSNVTSVKIPNSLKGISNGAFRYCTSLTELTLPSGTTYIADYTYSYCNNLSTITIPKTVTSIGNAFQGLPTQGTLYCDEDWYANLTQTQINNLGVVYNWKINPKPTEKRINDIENNIVDLQNNKAEKSDLNALEDDVDVIDGKVSTLEEKVAEIEQNDYLTKGEGDTYYQPIGDYALKSDIPTVPTKVSAFENDKGYLTEHQSLDDYALKSEIPTDYVNNNTFVTYTAATAQKIAEIEEKGYDDTEIRQLIAELDDNKAEKSDLNALGENIGAIDGKVSTLEEKVAEIEQNDYLTKEDCDTYYQPIGDYATKDEIPTDYVDNNTFITYTAATDAKIAEIEEKGYDDTEVRQLIQGNTDSINSLEGSLTDVIDTVEELSSKVDESVSQSDFDTYTANTEAVLSDKADKSEIPSLDGYATEDDITSAISNQKFKTINNESILGEGNIVIQGGGEPIDLTNYLDKTFTGTNILKGKIQIGDATTNVNNAILHIRNVGTSSITGKNVNGACYSVNSDGTCTLQHKTYNDDGSGARNAAVLRMSNKGLQFAINTGTSASPTEAMYQEIATQKYVDDIVGQIDTILSSL